jgi:hypothetical protein
MRAATLVAAGGANQDSTLAPRRIESPPVTKSA